MQLLLHSTTRLVEIDVNGTKVPARVWEGYTQATGIHVIALVTRIAVADAADQTQFVKELEQCTPPTVNGVQAFPDKMIL